MSQSGLDLASFLTTQRPSTNTGKMNFAIEVPGEASPLTLQELCKALEAATSMDNSQRQAAGKQLSTWETQKSYFPSLQVCFCPLVLLICSL